MKRRMVCLWMMALACLFTLGACKGADSASIVGTWKHDVQDATYAFNENGSLEIVLAGGAPIAASYAVDSENRLLTVNYTELSQQCTYEIKGDQLILTDTSNLAVITLTRVQSR